MVHGLQKFITGAEAKKNNRFVSGAPGDEKIVHPGGRKNILKKMMFEADWSLTNIALSYDKFKSNISSPCKREYHLGYHENWLLMGKKPENCTRKKTQLDISLDRSKKKNWALRPVGDEKKTYPAGAPETNPYFLLA